LHQHLLASLKDQWKRYRRRLKRCRRDFSEEAVHDLRVEIRRLLSAAELTGTCVSERRREKNRRLLKQHLDWFGELRDAQVQLLLLEGLARRFAAARLFRDYVLEHERAALRAAARRLGRFKPGRLKRCIDRIRREIKARRTEGLEAHDLEAARAALDRAFAAVLNLQAKVDPARRETIHRTRVAFKKYRYMVDALAPLLPGVSPRRQEAMHRHQTLMGNVQDLEVLSSAFEAFAASSNVPAPLAGALRRELARRRKRTIQTCLNHARQLNRFQPAASWLGANPASGSSSHLP
jgi:CHAD domain-containing protein